MKIQFLQAKSISGIQASFLNNKRPAPVNFGSQREAEKAREGRIFQKAMEMALAEILPKSA